MKIAIYGAGSLGTVIGAFLTDAGYTVDLITRNRAHLDGLNRTGARITGKATLTVPVTALSPEDITAQYDFIFLLTKQGDNEAMVKKCAQHLSDTGVICTFQNGLPERLIGECIGPERTFGCTVSWGATLHGNGISELTSDPQHLTFTIGQITAPVNKQKLEEISVILSTIGNTTIIDNFIGARWSKLFINSSYSAVSAICGCTLGRAAQKHSSRRCIQRLMKECINVTGAAGITIPPVWGKDIVTLFDYRGFIKKKIAYLLIPAAIKKYRLLTASMLHDIQNGKPTEVEFINGAVRDTGRDVLVPTPYHEMVIDVMHRIESGELKPGFENMRFFQRITHHH